MNCWSSPAPATLVERVRIEPVRRIVQQVLQTPADVRDLPARLGRARALRRAGPPLLRGAAGGAAERGGGGGAAARGGLRGGCGAGVGWGAVQTIQRSAGLLPQLRRRRLWRRPLPGCRRGPCARRRAAARTAAAGARGCSGPVRGDRLLGGLPEGDLRGRPLRRQPVPHAPRLRRPLRRCRGEREPIGEGRRARGGRLVQRDRGHDGGGAAVPSRKASATLVNGSPRRQPRCRRGHRPRPRHWRVRPRGPLRRRRPAVMRRRRAWRVEGH
mmetsp:Transcript_111008/g.353720  ORF Transcript_111008/g.353720 Transcript_111008/m.353720 type:complete len:271 (+) Transcript_111008:96-908(+)